jgi:hypothetical protein
MTDFSPILDIMLLDDPRQFPRKIIATPTKKQDNDVAEWQGSHPKPLSDRIRTRVIRAARC